MRLRLHFRPRPEPVLTEDEQDWLAQTVHDEIIALTKIIDTGQASESHIRNRMYARDVLNKLEQAGAWIPGKGKS